ncbi:MAG TPA: hypothetical protein IAA29_06660 [Candidatus Paenibacillus intestinavium]|nr:hypothetical protein [Candidatus Paenibacillus intestinavium]
MITLVKIDKLISTMLTSSFPDIEVISTDVEEGFARPSFKVVLENIRFNELQNYTENDMTVRIYFFPTSMYDYSVEVLEKQHELRKLFNYTISIDDQTIIIHEASTDVTDKILWFEFNISYLDSSNRQQPVYDDLEELVSDVETI